MTPFEEFIEEIVWKTIRENEPPDCPEKTPPWASKGGKERIPVPSTRREIDQNSYFPLSS
jgi:hypothetical protein